MKKGTDELEIWAYGNNIKISKRVYEGDCTGNDSVGRPRKGLIDSLKQKVLKLEQGRRGVYDRN